jgi:hypothetical protein
MVNELLYTHISLKVGGLTDEEWTVKILLWNIPNLINFYEHALIRQKLLSSETRVFWESFGPKMGGKQWTH